MQHQEILFKQAGQSFRFDPPDGRPASEPGPTVRVFEGDREIAATSGACAVDPVDTRLDGDVSGGGKMIRVVSADGIVRGGRYLMTKPDGDREWIEVVAIDGCALTLRHPVIHRYAGNATIVGCRISIAVDATWAASARNLSDIAARQRGLAGYVLRWTYVIDGFELAGISFADLVSCRAEQIVTPHDVDKRCPGWIAGLPPEHRQNQGADFIAEAFRAVRVEAIGSAHAQRKVRDAQVLRELVNIRAQVIRIEHDVMHGEPRSADLARAEQRYEAAYARLVDKRPTDDPASPAAKRSEPGTPRRIPKLTNQ